MSNQRKRPSLAIVTRKHTVLSGKFRPASQHPIFENFPFMLTPTVLFKCLSDETRMRCTMLLYKEGKLCVCELTHALAMLQPKISRHLAQLRQHKLLLDSREGQWVYYQINPALPAWVLDIFNTAAEQLNNDARQQKDRERLHTMKNRPDLRNCCN